MSDFMHFDNNFLPLGVVLPTASDTIPAGWLLCDGSEVSRETYAALFSAIGTTYGEGDSSTTFNIPDMRNRIAVGNLYSSFITNSAYSAGSTTIQLKSGNKEILYYGAGDRISYGDETIVISAIQKTLTSYYTVTLTSPFSSNILVNSEMTIKSATGKTGGEKMHKLTTAEMPAHSHTYSTFGGSYTNSGDYEKGRYYSTSNSTGYSGGSEAHNNMPPFVTTNYIIYAGV